MPAVRGYDRVGAKGSHQLAMKFPEAMAAGFVAGCRNRLTVVDIDRADERLLGEIQDRFGDTPFQVVTPSGGWHLYYRYGGEARRIRPLPDVDILGGGNVVAALSVVPKGRYQIERGSLDDLAALPPMRQERQQPADSIPKGQRNQALFEYCRRTVSHCDDLDELVDAARTWADNNLAEPLPAAEVMKTCNSVWNYRGDRKRIMNHIVESEAYASLVANTDALALFAFLSAENGLEAAFMIADGLGEARGWSRRFVPTARRALLAMGVIECVRRPRPGSPGLYRWKVSTPDIPKSVGNPSSPSPLPANLPLSARQSYRRRLS
jgi:hypothetical protein